MKIVAYEDDSGRTAVGIGLEEKAPIIRAMPRESL